MTKREVFEKVTNNDIRTRLLTNTLPGPLSSESDLKNRPWAPEDIVDLVSSSFNWDYTPEGYDYWADIAVQLLIDPDFLYSMDADVIYQPVSYVIDKSKIDLTQEHVYQVIFKNGYPRGVRRVLCTVNTEVEAKAIAASYRKNIQRGANDPYTYHKCTFTTRKVRVN